MAETTANTPGRLESKRQRCEILRAQLESERSSFLPTWRDCGDYILPRRPRFLISDTNKGERRSSKIIDGTAKRCLRTLRAGMMSGMTPRSRPWFRVTTTDPNRAESPKVKEWCEIVSKRLAAKFLKSNLYTTLPIVYGDLGTFGTSALMAEEDEEDGIRFYVFPIGSYMIANDHRYRAAVFFREFRMTVRQLVKKFGYTDPKAPKKIDWSRFSENVKNSWDTGKLETWVDVCHVVQPNDEHDPKRLGSEFKKFSSTYYEKGRGSDSYGGSNYNQCLREKGYDYFHVMCPRWEVTGEDSYASSCPGIDSMGDIKALQTMQKRKAQAVEKMVNPPMKAPSSLKSAKPSILPGEVTYSDERENQRGFTPVHEVRPQVQELMLDIQDTRQMIRQFFFEDLFLMLQNEERSDITATEVVERKEEKLMVLGPVLEQMDQDLFDPLIDIGFTVGLERGWFPPPPEELWGEPLEVEYVSVMAQAQKLMGISGVERLVGFVTQLGGVIPSAMAKLNSFKVIDTYSEMTSAPVGIIRSDDEANQILQQQSQAATAQAQSQIMKDRAGAVKSLSQADLSGDNALAALLDGSGAAA